MSIAEKLTTIAENEQKVYNAGIEKGIADNEIAYVDRLTGNGTKTNYSYAFRESNFPENYSFAKTIVVNNACQMFYNMSGQFPGNVDMSAVTGNAPYESYGTYAIFAWSTRATYLCDMNLQAPKYYTSTWAYCSNLITIEKIRVNENTQFSTSPIGLPFQNCYALENVTFEGVIGHDISFAQSTKLTHDSLMNIINCLKDYSEDTSGTTHTLTIGTINQAKLTDTEKAIATQKGWTIA